MKELVKQYQMTSSDEILLSFGSTGKHFAQIHHGAPFDIFFAADSKRPELLESSDTGIKGSRFTYAYGHLALWSTDINKVDNNGLVLQQANFRHLAIANPKLAPYGIAAMDVLQHLRLKDKILPKLVYGENISQTYQFIVSENVELGFIAYSQLKQRNNGEQGSYWLVPESMHRPIEQQAIQLKQNSIADDFLRFVKSNDGQKIIRQFGYSLKNTSTK
jgi:molybdate transport system substrate-binding protein